MGTTYTKVMAGNSLSAMDTQIGAFCSINGKDAYETFCADLKAFELAPNSIDYSAERNVSLSKFTVAHYRFGPSKLTVVFYVSGTTKDGCFLNCSNLVAECSNCVIEIEDSEFEYVAVLVDFSVAETGVDFFNEVSLTFTAIKRARLVSVVSGSGSQSFNVTNAGSVESGCLLRLYSNHGSTHVTWNGNRIEVTGLLPDVPFDINGIEGTVTADGLSALLNTNLINFPKVIPGANTLVKEYDDDVVEIQFYPTYIT